MTDTQQPAGPTTGPTSTPSVVHHGHGNSVAAWTAVGIVILGSIVMLAGVIATSWVISILGAMVCVAGAAAGKVLSAMGFGVAGKSGHH
jgi:hypothetical protein